MGSSVTVVKWSRRAAQKHLPRDRHGEKQEISKWKWVQRHAGARRLDLPQAAADYAPHQSGQARQLLLKEKPFGRAVLPNYC